MPKPNSKRKDKIKRNKRILELYKNLRIIFRRYISPISIYIAKKKKIFLFFKLSSTISLLQISQKLSKLEVKARNQGFLMKIIKMWITLNKLLQNRKKLSRKCNNFSLSAQTMKRKSQNYQKVSKSNNKRYCRMLILICSLHINKQMKMENHLQIMQKPDGISLNTYSPI